MPEFSKAKPALRAAASLFWRNSEALMTCPVCGKPHPCAHARSNSPDLSHCQATGATGLSSSGQAAGARIMVADEGQDPASGRGWRQEVASRVRQHRARRRANADPNALELDFSAEEPYSFAAEPAEGQ